MVLAQLKQYRDAWLTARFEEISSARTVALMEVASSIRNGMVGKVVEGYVPEGILYLVSKNVRSNRLQLNEISFVSDDFHRDHPKSQLQPFDILTVQSGHVGETCVVPPDLGAANCHALIITTPKLDVVDPYYVSFYLNSTSGKRQVARITIGSALQHINTSELQKLEIPFPSLKKQRSICDSALQMDGQIAAYAKHVDILRLLKAQLIHSLV